MKSIVSKVSLSPLLLLFSEKQRARIAHNHMLAPALPTQRNTTQFTSVPLDTALFNSTLSSLRREYAGHPKAPSVLSILCSLNTHQSHPRLAVDVSPRHRRVHLLARSRARRSSAPPFNLAPQSSVEAPSRSWRSDSLWCYTSLD
jgi:hypothetical protein